MENCRTCYRHIVCGCGGMGDFQEDSKKRCFKPDYSVLESNLEKANALIKEQIEQIAELKEALRLACYDISYKCHCCSFNTDCPVGYENIECVDYLQRCFITQAQSNQKTEVCHDQK
jgi:hypothetical protein